MYNACSILKRISRFVAVCDVGCRTKDDHFSPESNFCTEPNSKYSRNLCNVSKCKQDRCLTSSGICNLYYRGISLNVLRVDRILEGTIGVQ